MSNLDPHAETQRTRWSLISRARGDSPEALAALEELARIYRDPIRDYIAAAGRAADADDLTQEFFTRKFLRASFLNSVHRGTGSFRTFLKLCVKRFLIDCHRGRRRPGAGPTDISLDQPPDPDSMPPELLALEPSADRALDQSWARAVIGRARTRLVAEFARAQKTVLGEHFIRELEDDSSALGHREIAALTGLSPGAVTTSFYRFRERLRHLVREELEATVSDPKDAELERRNLWAAFAPSEALPRLVLGG